jgi:hypothetical protein
MKGRNFEMPETSVSFTGFDTIVKRYAFIGFPKDQARWPEYFGSLYDQLNSAGQVKKFSKEGAKRATPKRCEGILREMSVAFKARPIDIGNGMVVLVPIDQIPPEPASVTAEPTPTAPAASKKRDRKKSKK